MTTTKTRILADGSIKIYEYETYKEYNNKYYIENKEKILVKTMCECGGHYHVFNKLRHFRTKKHLVFLEQNQVKNL
jgi:hypothetical protein